jgi:hypothetical protein
VTFLAPKVVLTPLLIASASLAGRRWGALTSGWLLALPLTSGPIALFISLDLGRAAGEHAATGSLVGATAQVAFALAYGLASRRVGWPGSLTVASFTFALCAAVVSALAALAPPVVLWGLAAAAVATGLALPILRSGRVDAALSGVRPGRWDIPARATVATVLVIAISGSAPIVGGHVAGILATFPVYVSVLATFAHRLGGPSQARGVLRGLLLGLPGFATFFLVVSALLEPAGITVAFVTALAGAVTLNLAVLAVAVRRTSA